MFNKRQRFSIRKLSLGVASVLLGAISVSAMTPVSAQDVPAEGVVENLVPAAGTDEALVPAAGTDNAPTIADRYDIDIPKSLYIYAENDSFTPEEQNKIIEAFMEANPYLKTTLDYFEFEGMFIKIHFIDGSHSTVTLEELNQYPNLPVLTEVEDVMQLTDEEKERVALAVINANYALKNYERVYVNSDGSVRVIYLTGNFWDLNPKQTIVPKGTKVETIADKTTPEFIQVEGFVDLKALTQEEKDAIKASIEAGNPVVPAGLEYGFEDDGELTLFYSEEARNTIFEAAKKANPNLPEGTEIMVDYNGDLIFIYSDGSEDVFLAEYVLAKKQENTAVEETTVEETTVAETTVEEVVTETETPAPVAEKAELPNTGTASSIVSIGAAATAMLLGLGVLKRKED